MASVAEAMKQYGFVGQLANSNPELRVILTRAAAGNWSADEFSRAVQDSHWWKTSADSIKQSQILRVTKPGEYNDQIKGLRAKVQTLGAEMGVDFAGAVGAGRIRYLASMAQMHAWDEATLRQQIGYSFKVTRSSYGGQAGQIQQQIRQAYYDMGVPYTEITVGNGVRAILEGRQSVDGIKGQVMDAAKSRYPALAAQLAGGQTVRQIADPYLSTKAQLLEVPPESISLQDPTVKQALSHRDDKGQVGLMPLWQYEQQVKADPKWDKTKNARDAYSAMAHQIGRDWGFST